MCSDYDFKTAKKEPPPKLVKQPSQQAILASQKVKRAKQKMASAKKGKMIVVAGRKSSTPGDSPSTIGSIKRKPKKKPLVEPAPQGVNEPSVIKHTVPASASITTGTTDENNQTSKDDVVLGSDVPVASPSGPTDSPSKLSLPPVMSALSPNSSENEGEGNPLEGIKGLPPPLPPDLPKELLMKIDEMKQAFAKGTAGDKKLSLKARSDLDTQMIEIEKACGSSISQKTRTAVYNHIAGIMNVKRSSIMSRTVKQMKKREGEKLTVALEVLKKDVEDRMVPLLKKYDEELLTASSSGGTGIVSEGNQNTGEPMDTSTQSGSVVDGTSLLPVVSGNQTQSGQQAKVKKARKHFKWDNEVKVHLRTVVRIKINQELAVQKKLSNVEEFLGKFLDESVRPLWPKGWMSRRVLLKMSEPAYKHLLPVQDQPTKKPLSTQPVTSSTSIGLLSSSQVITTSSPTAMTISSADGVSTSNVKAVSVHAIPVSSSPDSTLIASKNVVTSSLLEVASRFAAPVSAFISTPLSSGRQGNSSTGITSTSVVPSTSVSSARSSVKTGNSTSSLGAIASTVSAADFSLIKTIAGTLDRLQAEKGMLPKSDSVAKASVIPSVKVVCTVPKESKAVTLGNAIPSETKSTTLIDPTLPVLSISQLKSPALSVSSLNLPQCLASKLPLSTSDPLVHISSSISSALSTIPSKDSVPAAKSSVDPSSRKTKPTQSSPASVKPVAHTSPIESSSVSFTSKNVFTTSFPAISRSLLITSSASVSPLQTSVLTLSPSTSQTSQIFSEHSYLSSPVGEGGADVCVSNAVNQDANKANSLTHPANRSS
jgi:ubinuclein